MIGEHALFDVAAWLGALAMTWALYQWRFEEEFRSLSMRLGAGYFASLTAGGVLGAYGFGTLNLAISGQPGVGRSVLGGLLGAIALIELYKLKAGIRGSTGIIFAAPFCFAIAIGRIGCHRAGIEDFTYGIATTLPWGVDLGDGILRHPAPLYEALTMALVGSAIVLGLRSRRRWAMRSGFYVAMAAYGLQRFFWEFVKPYAAAIGPFNVFHLLSILLFVYAVGLMISAHDQAS